MYETALTAKIKRFSESTRKNLHYFPKYMDYRTKRLGFHHKSPRFMILQIVDFFFRQSRIFYDHRDRQVISLHLQGNLDLFLLPT